MWVATADVPVDGEATGKGDSCGRGMNITSLGLDFGQDSESVLSPSTNPPYAKAGPPRAITGQVG